MNISADEFLKQAQKKKSSKLEPYLDDILKLRAAKLSYDKIREFLQLNGIETTTANLSWFVRSRGQVEIQAQSEVKKAAPTENVKIAHEVGVVDSKSNYTPPSWATNKSWDELI